MSNARHTLHCRSLLFLSSTLTLPWRLSAPFVDHTAPSFILGYMRSSLCECQEAGYNGTSRAVALSCSAALCCLMGTLQTVVAVIAHRKRDCCVLEQKKRRGEEGKGSYR